MTEGRPRREAAVVFVVLAVALALYAYRYLPLLSASHGTIGNDWDVFLPYLFSGDQWFATNGPFAVPWMTPALCGGIPFYPNPRNTYYTPAQWLSFVVSPLTAVHIVFILYVAVGALGMYLLLRRSFRQSLAASLLGALLFMFNGFSSHRMLIGHFEFRAFLLTPLAAFLLLRPGPIRTRAFNGILAGCLFALMFQSGMVNLAAPMGLAVLWLGLANSIERDGLRGFLLSGVISLATATALCGAKLASASAFVSNFPRDYLPLPGIPSIPTLLAVAFRMLFWRATPEISHAWVNVRVHMALHEWEYGLTPIALALIAFWLWTWWTRPEASFPKTAAKRGLVAVLVVLVLVPLAVNFYDPGWNAFLKHLPLINHMSSLSRWFAFYLPVCALLAAWGVDAIPSGGRLPVVALAAVGVILFQWNEGPEHVPVLGYDPAPIEEAWTRLHQTGQATSIDHVIIATQNGRPLPQINGDNALTEGASQGACYEAVFGYKLQFFPYGLLHDGPSLDLSDGVLNVKEPACFLYPKENGCVPGDQFPVDRRTEAERFLAWKPIAFEVPASQRLADGVNVFALIAVPILLLALRRKRKPAAGTQDD